MIEEDPWSERAQTGCHTIHHSIAVTGPQTEEKHPQHLQYFIVDPWTSLV